MSNILNKMFLIFLADNGDDPFASLKDIGNKIIPSDIWSFVIQIAATFILVLILAKFLVKPARKFIEARKAYIASNLSEAEEKNKQADANLQASEEKLKQTRKESMEIIESARINAMSEKNRIVDETKQEVNSLRDKALKDIESERNKMREDISNEVIDVALLAASKVVNRNINDDDSRKIVSDFVNKGDNE